MLDTLKDLFTSKKFIAMIIAVAIVLGARHGYIQLDPTSVTNIVITIASYILGQGLADLGKEKA